MSKLVYYNHEFLDRMRQEGDPLADQAVHAIFNSPSRGQEFRTIMAQLNRNNQEIQGAIPEALRDFLEESSKLPSWANPAKMKRATEFFARYRGDLMLMLGMMSLPYDYAAAKGVQVLYRSKRLVANPGKRLMETGQYVLNVTAHGGFSPWGKAISSIQKVRLMHAAIRYHLIQSGSWDTSEFGLPINQEDMGGTNLSMGMLPVRGLRKLNLNISLQEASDYLHLWNVASAMMGVDERLLPDTAKDAYVYDKMIRTRQHAPSEAGKTLTKSLLDFIDSQVEGKARKALPTYMRFLLGDRVANDLGVPHYDLSGAFMIKTSQGINQLRRLFPFFSSLIIGNRQVQPTTEYGDALFAIPLHLQEK